MKNAKQLELPMNTHGGRREGAGCKRKNARATVAHVERPTFKRAHPVQVTMRFCDGIPNLRERPAWAVVVRVMRAMRERGDFRVVHYSVMWNHIHAIVEADSHAAFVSAMRSLTIRLALALNGHFGRKGKVFDHRYDACALTCPRHVRSALQYVLLNARKHAAEQGETYPADWVDPRSTSVLFDGWSTPPPLACGRDFGIVPAQTWLLDVGWRQHGLLRLDAIPGDLAVDSANVARAA
ncbi:MAG TPA: transposase [Nannocystaceae bacterium]|nr:transposase [Nannocystaceae bacterium]